MLFSCGNEPGMTETLGLALLKALEQRKAKKQQIGKTSDQDFGATNVSK